MRTALLLLLGFLAGLGQADALSPAPPHQIGLSKAKLQILTEHLKETVDAGQVAGAVALVARHGKIGYFEAVGDDLNADSLFRIASMTKAITSTAVMQLVEEGEIALEDPLEKYLPEFSRPRVLTVSGDTVLANRPPTIHHLLTHTSGIGYGWFGPEAQDQAYQKAGVSDLLIPAEMSLEEHVRKLAELPLAFHPGDQWAYGLSIDVLGRVVEIVTGLTLAQYFEERIFRPLDLEDTTFYLPPAKQDRLASLYTPNETLSALEEVGSTIRQSGPIRFSADYCLEGKGHFFAGGSGLVSSTIDYARFLQALLDGGGPLLNAATVSLMTRNQIGEMTIPFPGHGDGFGYGFGVLTERGIADDRARVGTYSWGGIFNTYYWIDPQEELVGILMTQVFPNGHLTLREDFKGLVYDAIDDSGFYREYWYEQGEEHANPFFNARQLRVNAPEASTHETFSTRSEPRSSGLARIRIDEDLRAIRRAELYTEIWGGHPGTANKRVGVNGRTLFPLPENGTATKHCTHLYPSFNLSPNDLVNGYNSLQFACDQGTTFWGHYIVDNACLRIGIDAEDPQARLPGFHAEVVALIPEDASEPLQLRLHTSHPEHIASVHYQGHYFGYDENGNGFATDWHGMTKHREPYGMLGGSEQGPLFEVSWDTSMLPQQPDLSVRAFVRFKNRPALVYTTSVLTGLPLRHKEQVTLHHVTQLPAPFWSRANRPVTATITLDHPPSDLAQAELHVVSWTGGSGEVKEYFTLNGHPLPVAEGHDHSVHYVRLPIDPALLKQGENELVLLSDTEHHGIEVLLPGPALVIRRNP